MWDWQKVLFYFKEFYRFVVWKTVLLLSSPLRKLWVYFHLSFSYFFCFTGWLIPSLCESWYQHVHITYVLYIVQSTCVQCTCSKNVSCLQVTRAIELRNKWMLPPDRLLKKYRYKWDFYKILCSVCQFIIPPLENYSYRDLGCHFTYKRSFKPAYR